MLNPTLLTYRHRILRVQLFIQEHLDEELPLDRLAREAHLSPYHFHRVFGAMVGESLGSYVRRLRLERAAMMLKLGDRPVTLIAFDAGYGTLEAFSRAFRQAFGVSPSRYRSGRHAARIPLQSEPPTMDATTTFDVTISDEPPRLVAFLRHVGPYAEVGPTFQRLGAWAGPRGLLGPASEIIGLGWDDPEVTAPEKLRFDCCLVVPEGVGPEGEVGVRTIDGGPYAVLRVVGPYDLLPLAYRHLYGTWLPSSGREPKDVPPFEIYRNSPMDTAPERLVTDIYLALAPR